MGDHMTKQQLQQGLREYATYVQVCEEFNEQPQLLEAVFVKDETFQRNAPSGYNLYLKECRENGIEPTLADFLLKVEEWYTMLADLRDSGTPFVIWEEPTPRRKARGAAAGR
jgi:hypothetical protein